MSESNPAKLDLRTASSRDLQKAMNRGALEALRFHTRVGNPVVVWDRKTGEIVTVPPEEIPDELLTEDDDETPRPGGPRADESRR
jgi:hypothetical protein